MFEKKFEVTYNQISSSQKKKKKYIYIYIYLHENLKYN